MRRAIVAVVAALSLSSAASAASNRVTLPFGQDVFVSGINVAWKGFSGDVGKYPIDTAWFATMLQGVADSGGNAIRWWLFTNCANDPQFDPSTKLVKGLGASTVSNVRTVLDMAYARGVSISLCLLSFDMMKGNQGSDTAANRRILQTTAGRKAFIDNAVVPLVKAIGRHPAILDWEIFNEPEGMVKSIAGDWGSLGDGIVIGDVQAMVNQAAGAIHRAVPGVLVSNGCWAFIAGSDAIQGDRNYYTDSALKAAGGDPDGTLDFYMVHYYEWAGRTRSPFHHPASYWKLDKPLVIGEFPAKGLSDSLGPMSPAQCWRYLLENGYAGAMGWTYTAHDGFGGLPEAGLGMRAVRTDAPGAIVLDFPPSATDDWYADSAGATLVVAAPGVLANDVEPTKGQNLSASILVPAGHGVATLSASGAFTYVPMAGWTGTDRFVYVATGGAGMEDTATVVVRVLDPSRGAFLAPPSAGDWKAYAAWGKVGVQDHPAGLGVSNAQWGGSWEWIAGTGVPVRVTPGAWTVSVQVRNDPGSPWGALRFHLGSAASLGNYGPQDTGSLLVELAAQETDANGFAEWRGTFQVATAAELVPELQFVWNDTDGNGPNSAHLSVVRDIEIFPSAVFPTGVQARPGAAPAWRRSGDQLLVQAPGKRLVLEVSDLAGRRVDRREAWGALRWRVPRSGGLMIATLHAGDSVERFLLPASVR